MRTLRNIDQLPDLAGKTVLVRADLDVPLENGEITSDYRVQRAAITIRELVEKHARVVVLAHLGRPEGEYSDEFSLMPVRFELGKILDMHIKFAHMQNSKNSIIFMEDAEVLLLENIRFDAREGSDNEAERHEFIQELVDLADYYINDAFATYRQQASTWDLAKAFDAPMAGRQLVREIEQLTQLREDPKHPYVAVIGGAKLDTKIDILQDLATKADKILIGGAMAYTILKAQGINVGKSKVQDEILDTAKQILATAKENNCEIFLPIDHIAGREFDQNTERIIVDTQQIPDDLMGLDIGERTMAAFLEQIKSARTIMWNGPMGVFEWENFARGTEAIGEYIGLSAPKDTFKVAGGGDTVAAMQALKINFKNFHHVSTGGGAMLEYLATGELPTLEPLFAE